MRAMVLESPGGPLLLRDLPTPRPGHGQVRLRVHACGVCRTDLPILHRELAPPKLPLVPGHQTVGTVVEAAPDAAGIAPGERIGVPWLGWTCGRCRYCLSGRENLCENARFTGYDIDGGFAEECVADVRYAFRIP